MEIERLAENRKRIYDEKDDAWKEKAMTRNPRGSRSGIMEVT